MSFFYYSNGFSKHLGIYLLPPLFFTYVYAPKIVLLFFCVFRLPASLLVKRPLAYRELNTHEAGEQRIAVHAGIGLGHGWVLVGGHTINYHLG
jgi:hypothetical protein